jgi:PAS domain S-box-containing protein
LRKTRKDGTVIWVQETVRLVQGADGRQTFLVMCDDITTRKQAELARREADLRYRTIFEQAGVGVARLDSRSGRFIEINRRKCEILGYSASELLMTTSMAITHPEDLDRDLDNMGRLVRGEIRGFTMEKRLVRRDGAAVWVNLTVSPLWREGDEPREHIAVIEDITKSKQAADALRETERRTRAIVETAMDAVIVMDERGVITEWNPQAERIFAWTRAEAVGRRLSDTVIPARLRHSHEEGLRGYLRTDHGQVLNTRVEMPALRRDGTEFPVELAIAPLKLEGATIFAAFVRDITDRKGAEESLRLFRALLDQATDAVEVIDPATARFLDCNANAHEALGYSRAELLTLGVPDIDPLVPLPVFTNHIAQLRECGALTLETVHRRKDGSTFPVEVHGRLIRLDREYFLTIVRDITQRKKAEEERSALLGELQSANNALGRLSHQLMQVQEAERQQLARDLHDEIGQALTAVTINLQSLSQRQDQVAQAPEMRDSLTIVDRLVHHVRDLCLDLRPSLLDDLGLVPALRWFLNRQGTRAGWSVEFAADDAIPPLPEPVQVACFRIAQEALTNVMRHAGARRVGVALRRVHDQLELTVTDDGIGFAVTPAGTAHGLPAGLGLAGMKERARYAGGEWTIQSSPGHGTTIRARLPISGLATTKTGQFSEVLT